MTNMSALAQAFLFVALTSFSAAAAQEPPEDIQSELFRLQQGVLALRGAADARIISEDQYDAGVDWYFDRAEEHLGTRIPRNDLLAFKLEDRRFEDRNVVSQAELTALQKFAGLITFVNISWVLAIILFVICACWLFGRWFKRLMELLKSVPLAVYEAVCYLVSVALIIYGKSFGIEIGQYFGLTGCLFFGGAMIFTNVQRGLKFGFGFYSVLFLAWAAAALL